MHGFRAQLYHRANPRLTSRSLDMRSQHNCMGVRYSYWMGCAEICVPHNIPRSPYKAVHVQITTCLKGNGTERDFYPSTEQKWGMSSDSVSSPLGEKRLQFSSC